MNTNNINPTLAERIDEIRACAQADQVVKALGNLMAARRLENTREARRAAWGSLASIAETRCQELDRPRAAARKRAPKPAAVGNSANATVAATGKPITAEEVAAKTA